MKASIKFGVLRENRRQEAASHGSALFGFGIDLSALNTLGVPMIISSTGPRYRTRGTTI